MKTARVRLSSGVQILAFTTLGLIVSLIVAAAYFGSIGNGIRVLRGQALTADRYSVDVGERPAAATNDIVFTLTNWSRSEVNLLGGRGSCTCLVIDDLPTKVGPGAKFPLRVRVGDKSKSRPGRFQDSIRVFTDRDSQSEMTFQISGSINDDSAGNRPSKGTAR